MHFLYPPGVESVQRTQGTPAVKATCSAAVVWAAEGLGSHANFNRNRASAAAPSKLMNLKVAEKKNAHRPLGLVIGAAGVGGVPLAFGGRKSQCCDS